MKPIRLQWIEAFRAVAQAGSTLEAAQILHIDQSAVSRHLAALEGQLGVQLFDRSQRRLRITAEGALLVSEAESALDAVRRFQFRAQDVGRMDSGHLHVVTSATLARGLMPRVIQRFRQQAKDVSIHVEVVARSELDKKVESQQFDICAIAQPFPYPPAQTVELGAYSGVCVLPRTHRLARRRSIALHQLADESLVGLPVGAAGRGAIDDLFRRANLTYQPQIETTAVALIEHVAAGLGIAITDPFTARAAGGSEIVVRPLSPTVHYEYALVFPINRVRSRLADPFAATLQSTIASTAKRQSDQ
ncbi:MAG: LysR substrate-binding domain-containing protein [Hyphomicrobiaceae bacterium]